MIRSCATLLQTAGGRENPSCAIARLLALHRDTENVRARLGNETRGQPYSNRKDSDACDGPSRITMFTVSWLDTNGIKLEIF